jgi:hypothetical protein
VARLVREGRVTGIDTASAGLGDVLPCSLTPLVKNAFVFLVHD